MTSLSPLTEEVSALLESSVADVLDVAFKLGAHPVEPAAVATDVVAAVGFTGQANGMVYLRVSAGFARDLARRMLGLADAEIEGDGMINDVIGELGNMVVGGVKSRLCDSGHPCVITIPAVMRGPRLQIEATGGAERRELHFQCDGERLIVELLMKPVR